MLYIFCCCWLFGNWNGFGAKINNWKMCLSCICIEFVRSFIDDVVIYVPLTPFACMLVATVPCSCWGFLLPQIGFDSVITFSLSMAHFLFEPLVSFSMRWSMSEQRLCVQYFCLKSLKVFFCCCCWCLIFKEKIGLS